MRFFYVQKVKKYIFLPAIVVFLFSLLFQFILPAFFFNELTVLSFVKEHLGYPQIFYANSSLLILRILFSLLYASISATLGMIYFRITNRKSGYTLITSKAFHTIAGITYLVIVYALLHAELFNFNTSVAITVPKFRLNSTQFTQQLRSFFMPEFKFSVPKNNTYTRYSQPVVPTYAPQLPPNTQPPQQPVIPTNPPRMATAQELLSELNSYRQRNGKAVLNWDTKLGNYAQSRANLFASIGNTDNHAGFNTDLKSDLHYSLCFFGLGENSSFGDSADAKAIIENWYGVSAPHNANQLNSSWSHVGIGVSGGATDFVFGGRQITASYEHAPEGCR